MNTKERKNISRKDISSVATLLDDLIEKAYEMRASDIHIDPKQNHATVDLRIDGLISPFAQIEIELIQEVVGRIKVLAGLRSDIHDKSQDGRFYKQGKGRIDIRVSVAPTYYGENVVLRLLAQDYQRVGNLSELGLSLEQRLTIEDSLKRNQGLIIVSGPTGAGKTSTLYSMLQQICSGERLIISIEDPVEYPLPDVRQIQLKSSQGYGFHQALRGILRQDPDVVMVGEIRDKETASVAVQIALTGHLIITSIHAEDAAHIVPRLIDMGIDPYLLAATVKVLISQRLIRKYDAERKDYHGRTGIFEVMNITDPMRELILERASADRLKEIAVRGGYKTMHDDGVKKVAFGVTTVEELKRVLRD